MSVCGRPSCHLLRPRKGGRCWSDADMTDTYEHVPWMLPSIDRLRRAWLDTCPECAPPDGQSFLLIRNHVKDVGSGMRWTRGCLKRACAPTKASARTAKPCGPVPRRWGQACETIFARRRWLKSPVHRGERGAAVKTIARGMPAVPAEPVVTAACFFCCRRAMGAACIRHSLRPLHFEGNVRSVTRA